jgi:CRISPR-associated endonuclease Cas3-HD
LHPQLLRPLPIEVDNDETKKEEKKEILDARKKVKALLPPIASAATSEKNVAEALQKALRSWPIATLSVSTLGVPCAALGEAIKSARVHSYPDSSGVVVSARIPLQNTTGSIHDHDLEFDEPDDDRASMHDGGNPVTLDDHTRAVVKTADTFARASALPDNLRAALEAAAYWHDQGKRDRRFQAWLHGSELAAFAALAEKPPRVLAKSARPTNGNALSSARFSYPKGHRHEFVSVRLFEKAGTRALRIPSHNSTTLTVTAEDADLVKFLIGTHHGRGRAFAPVSRDRHPVRISMDHDGARIEVSSDHALHTLDSGWSDLFWSLLRRYGWWGLAYLEAILITADHHVSASEQRPAAHSMTEAGAASSPSPSKSLAPIQPNLEASLQPNLPFSRATSAGSTTR